MIKKLNWPVFLVAVGLMVSSLPGCGTLVTVKTATKKRTGITHVIETETRQSKSIARKNVQIGFYPVRDGLGFRLQYLPQYPIERRSLLEVEVNETYGYWGYAVWLAETGVLYGLSHWIDRKYPQLLESESPLPTIALTGGIFYWLGDILLLSGLRTASHRQQGIHYKTKEYTPWTPSGTTVPGTPELIPNYPFTLSLPLFGYRDTYRTNSDGEFTIPSDKLIDNILNLEPLLRADSIRIDASTNFDGREQQESFIIGRSSDSFQAFLEQQRLRREKPADLVTEVAFSDQGDFIPNKILDAGERKGNIEVNIKNRGEGPGIDVQLHISSDNPHIQFAKTRTLGKIESKDQRTVNIPITTNLQAVSGIADILVEAKEKRGYDAQKKQLRIQVAELKPPHLTITVVEANDKTLGNAVGNGNGIPENDETIELNVFIKNGGAGDALGTKLELVSLNYGLEVQVRSASIGTIRPNQIVKGVLRFRIPRTFAAETLDYKLRVTEVRGADSAEKTDVLPMSTQRPTLAYHISPPTSITNGASAAFTITPRNTGKLRARDVLLKLSARNATIAPSTVNLGIIEADGYLQPQPFTVTLPRTFKASQLSLNVRFSQAEFNDLSQTENYPVKHIEPHLEIVERLVTDANGDGQIQQGEKVEFEVRVTNKGKLDALNAQMRVSVADARIRIDKPDRPIGRLAPNYTSNPERFAFTIPRAVPAGQLPVTVKVTHKDFPSVERALAYNIHTEGIVTTTETPTREAEQPQTPRPVVDNRPTILLPDFSPDTKAAPNTKTADSSSFPLRVVTSDDRGLYVVRVTRNGEHVYDSQKDPDAAQQLQESNGRLLSFDLKMSLQEGKNKVVIKAQDSNYQQADHTLNLIYERGTNVSNVGNPRIHALLILLGDDEDIRSSVERNRNHMQVLLMQVSQHANVNFTEMESVDQFTGKVTTGKLSDGNTTDIKEVTQGLIKGDQVTDWLKNLRTGQDDTIFIYYNGHGNMRDPDDEHILSFNKQTGDEIRRAALCKQLEQKQGRLRMLITDTCSNRVGTAPLDDPAAKYIPLATDVRERRKPYIENLFLQHTGTLDITAAQPDQRAWSNRDIGGLFTYVLVQQSITSESDTNKDEFLTWQEVFKTSQQKTEKLFKEKKEVNPPLPIYQDAEEIKKQETQKPFRHSLPTPAK